MLRPVTQVVRTAVVAVDTQALLSSSRSGRALLLPCPEVSVRRRGPTVPGLAAYVGGFSAWWSPTKEPARLSREGEAPVEACRGVTPVPVLAVREVPFDLSATASTGASHRLRTTPLHVEVEAHRVDAAVIPILVKA